jgi:hypothetical protein
LKKALLILAIICLCPTAFSQIINIETKRFLKDTNGFVGTTSGYFNINQNVEQVMSFGINQHVQYKYDRHRILSISDWAFINAGRTDFVNAGYQHIRYNYKTTSVLTWEAFVQAQYNKVLKLNRRYLAGTGPRVRLVKKENVKVYTACLYMYEYQQQNFDSTEQYNHRLSAYVSLTIGFKKVEFTSTTFYQPNIQDINNYRIANDSSFEFGINKSLNFKTSFNLLFDTRQPVGVPDLTYVLRNGLTYKF